MSRVERHSRPLARVSIVAMLAVLAAARAAAQVDFSGTWNTIRHEDSLDRGPGVGLGDYTGIPLTDAARQWAKSWDASRPSSNAVCTSHITFCADP
jgi:hypothetical protein